jgi:hypothetical protein
MRGQVRSNRTKDGKPVKVWNKLQNPFALVVQGFVVGGLLFWTTQGQAGPPAPVAPAVSTLSATIAN